VRPNEPALSAGGGVLTYFDWNDYADLLADALAERGLGSGDVIALACHNRMEWGVVSLAAAKVDARLLCLPPGLSAPILRDRLIAGRISAIIAGDCDPAVLTQALTGLPLLLRATMDEPWPGLFSFWDLFGPAAPPRFGHAQPSLIAWTAGTKGQAQAVALPRRRAAPASISRPPMPEHGASLITVPLHRAWGAAQFWEALHAGRAIAFMSRFDPFEALDIIRQRHITSWRTMPEHFQRLSALPAQLLSGGALASLREVVVGGAHVSAPLKSWMMATFGGDVVFEAYGSAETGLVAMMPANRQDERPGSCGRPIKGVLVEIRGPDGTILPRNAIGEVWARTPRSLEADFISHPAIRSRRDERGFAAAGDRGRLDEDGYLYIEQSLQDARRAG
jgi:long-chain acyl-CoA synthetase